MVMYGKVMPNAQELEQAILGAILMEKEAFEVVSDILQPESFYLPEHQIIFRNIINMHYSFKKIDILTLIEHLKKTNELESAGGPYNITLLTKDVVSSAHIDEHARIVQEKYLLRELVMMGSAIASGAFESSSDVFELINDAEKKLSTIALTTSKKSYSKIAKHLNEVVERVKMLKSREIKDGLIGVPSGIYSLDKCTAGWRAPDLIILAARPAVGKSGVSANFALNAAMSDVKPTNVGIFSLEMTTAQWCERFLSAESKIDNWKITRGLISDGEYTHLQLTSIQRLQALPIFIDDTPGIDLFELRSKARKMVKKDKVGLIIIDYLQLMSGSNSRGRNENREQEISSISRGLKGLAKELNVPIIALSQLNRSVEGKKGGPQLSDLRESGAIEQDADMVIFLVDPEEGAKAENADLKDSLLVKIAKHRNGPLDTISIKFIKEIQKVMSNVDYDQWMFLKQNPGLKPTDIPPTEKSKSEDDLPF